MGAVSTFVRGDFGELKTLQTLPWLVGAEILLLFLLGLRKGHALVKA